MLAAAVQQDDAYDLPAVQAVALYEALTTLGQVVDAMLCQPRFGAGPVCNAAGEVLSHLRDQIAEQAEAAIAAAGQGEPRGHYDRLAWAAARLRHASDASENVDLLVALAKALALTNEA